MIAPNTAIATPWWLIPLGVLGFALLVASVVMMAIRLRRDGATLNIPRGWKHFAALVLVFVAGGGIGALLSPLTQAPKVVTTAIPTPVSDPKEAARISELQEALALIVANQAVKIPQGFGPMSGKIVKFSKAPIGYIVLDANHRNGACIDADKSNVHVRGKFICEDSETGLKLKNGSNVDAGTMTIK